MKPGDLIKLSWPHSKDNDYALVLSFDKRYTKSVESVFILWDGQVVSFPTYQAEVISESR